MVGAGTHSPATRSLYRVVRQAVVSLPLRHPSGVGSDHALGEVQEAQRRATTLVRPDPLLLDYPAFPDKR